MERTENDQPIVIGDEIVNPGDIIRGDADGLVVVRREEAARVAVLSQEREDDEERLIKEYRSGKGVIELCKLAPVLAAKGLIVED